MESTVYKEILVPLDTSVLAKTAIKHARRLAQTSSAHVTFLVLSQSPSHFPWICDANGYVSSAGIEAQHEAESRLQSEMDDLVQFLRDLVVDLSAEGIAAGWTLASGKPSETICDHANRIRADLIVMTPHAPSGIRRWFCGNVADAVKRATPIPVLVV